MRLKRKKDGWWIVGAKWWDDHGPYEDKDEAEDDLEGLEKFEQKCLDKKGNVK